MKVIGCERFGAGRFACAHLSLSLRLNLPLATTDVELQRAAAAVGGQILIV
jgi:hypothetical protein